MPKYSSLKPEFIVCAAIWVDDGIEHTTYIKNIQTGYVLCGPGHAHCIMTSHIINPEHNAKDMYNSGFVTSHYRFVNREEAANIAYSRGQIDKQKEILYSEDLIFESKDSIYET